MDESSAIILASLITVAGIILNDYLKARTVEKLRRNENAPSIVPDQFPQTKEKLEIFEPVKPRVDLQFFGYLQKNEVRTVLFWASLVCATHLFLFIFSGRFGLLNSAFSYVSNPSVIVPVTATIIAAALSSPPRLHVMLAAGLPIIIYLRLGFDIVWGTIVLTVLLAFLIAFIIRCVARRQLPRW